MLEIFRYDDRSLRLQGGRQDMRVLWVWQSLTDLEKPVEVNDHRVLEGGLHLLPCARSAISAASSRSFFVRMSSIAFCVSSRTVADQRRRKNSASARLRSRFRFSAPAREHASTNAVKRLANKDYSVSASIAARSASALLRLSSLARL